VQTECEPICSPPSLDLTDCESNTAAEGCAPPSAARTRPCSGSWIAGRVPSATRSANHCYTRTPDRTINGH